MIFFFYFFFFQIRNFFEKAFVNWSTTCVTIVILIRLILHMSRPIDEFRYKRLYRPDPCRHRRNLESERACMLLKTNKMSQIRLCSLQYVFLSLYTVRIYVHIIISYCTWPSLQCTFPIGINITFKRHTFRYLVDKTASVNNCFALKLN